MRDYWRGWAMKNEQNRTDSEVNSAELNPISSCKQNNPIVEPKSQVANNPQLEMTTQNSEGKVQSIKSGLMTKDAVSDPTIFDKE